jgi:trehalose synthase
MARLQQAAAAFRQRMAGRVVWNINSTATGGGVAEMLMALVGYVQDLDIDIRWLVISGDADFFTVTKRLHNLIHGQPGDRGPLGPQQATHYSEVLAAQTGELLAQIRPGDLVLLHDPQTAGLTPALMAAGARVVWRCHIGADRQNDLSRSAWEFLRPYLSNADRYVFSRAEYVPDWVPRGAAWIIPPSIDPFSVKNQVLEPATVRAVLAAIGVLDEPAPQAPPRFVRRDGTAGQMLRPASVTGDGRPRPGDRLLVQVSRWDRLKDMPGVMRGFTEHVAPYTDGYLILAGPDVEGVSDDPEGAQVYAECRAMWRDLPADLRRRVLLLALPMQDVDENAVMVNALQRQATVIAQKSLAEGFGLTVAEGMWKGRPVVGSAVGGIQDQLVDGAGVLLADPNDLAAFGAAVRRLFDQPELARRMGVAAQAQVRDQFVGDVHLLRYAQLFDALIGE